MLDVGSQRGFHVSGIRVECESGGDELSRMSGFPPGGCFGGYLVTSDMLCVSTLLWCSALPGGSHGPSCNLPRPKLGEKETPYDKEEETGKTEREKDSNCKKQEKQEKKIH